MKYLTLFCVSASMLLFSSGQGIAETWASDSNGCKVLNQNPSPGYTITWDGRCSNGYADGNGVLEWLKDGKTVSRYEGDYVKGKTNGKGVYSYENGDRYEGEFIDGKKQGKGIFTAKGFRYEGDWGNDKSNGKGILTFENENRYEGDFLDDKQTGKGLYISKSFRYEGDFLNGKAAGKGILTWPSGDRYEGEFADGK